MREVLEHPFFSIGIGPQGQHGQGHIGQSQSLLDQGFVASTRNNNNHNNATIAVILAAAASNSFDRIEEEGEEPDDKKVMMLRDRNLNNSSSSSNPNPNPHNNILQKTKSESTDYSAENRENGGSNFHGRTTAAAHLASFSNAANANNDDSSIH